MTAKNKRLLSLDALRGFDMFWIISGEGIFHGLANVVMSRHSLIRDPDNWTIATSENLSFLEELLVRISNQLHHTPWNGFTFYDMIFPLFIFISGVSMPFSYDRYLSGAQGADKNAKRKLYLALVKRTLILILLGMVVNGLFKWQAYEETRFASVLGRIGLATFFAAIIYLNSSLKMQFVWFAMILTGYAMVMLWVPVPGYGSGVLTPEGNLSAYIDRLYLPGKLHRTVYDPEGLLSTIPAIASAQLGLFAGQFLKGQLSLFRSLSKTQGLLIAGLVLLAGGLLWSLSFPINKNMWTSSFVLFAGGWSMLLLALFYYLIDVAGFTKYSMPFVWVGTNSILIYIGAHFFLNSPFISQFLPAGTIAGWQEPVLWTLILILQLLLLRLLYYKKWFLKI